MCTWERSKQPGTQTPSLVSPSHLPGQAWKSKGFHYIVPVKLSPNCHTKHEALSFPRQLVSTAGMHFPGPKSECCLRLFWLGPFRLPLHRLRLSSLAFAFHTRSLKKTFPFKNNVEEHGSSVTEMWVTRPEMCCACCPTSCSSATESTVWTCPWSNRSRFKWGFSTLFDYLKQFMNKLLLRKIFME